MKKIPWVLLFVALPVLARDPPSGCAWLCGSWVLDAAHSESADTVVDAALETYKQPAARKPRTTHADNPVAQADADAKAAIAPVVDRPVKSELRKRLLDVLAPPASLTLGGQDDEILIHPADGQERHVFPDEPHSRVDAEGTAKISTEWKKNALVVDENYGRGRSQTETYALLPDGTLQVTSVVDRPGVTTLRLRVIYRRDQTQALESARGGVSAPR